MRKPLKPCGTRAAYLRHRVHDEDPCDACIQANRAYKRIESANRYAAKHPGPQPITTGAQERINEILFLLNAGEGEHRILQALGATPDALKRFLARHKQNHLIPRIFTPWDLAA